MKNLTLIAILMTFAAPALANTTPPVAVPINVSYASHNVTTSTYYPVLNLTAKGVKGIMIQDSSGQTMEVGVAVYGATANTESAQFIIPASSVNTFYPMNIAAGMRISIKAVSGTATGGNFAATVFYY